jgi:hypothetical protein
LPLQTDIDKIHNIDERFAISNYVDEIHIGKHSLVVSLESQKGVEADLNFGEKTMVLGK